MPVDGDVQGIGLRGKGMSGGGLPQFSQEEIMSNLLSASDERGDEEPDIAANITQQMLHMELEPLPRSMRSRFRDVVERLAPKRIIEVGAGIGNLSAWFHDIWEDGFHPEKYAMVDEGQRFGVILQRIVDRFDASSWCYVRVGSWDSMTSEATAWMAANASTLEAARSGAPLPVPADVIVVNSDWRSQVDDVEKSISLLRPGGVLLTPEPLVPSSDVGSYDAGKPETDEQQRVEVFNQWIRLIQEWTPNHAIGMVEVTGGTIVAIRRIQ
jgi:predicted O-methyltransferase YrrM